MKMHRLLIQSVYIIFALLFSSLSFCAYAEQIYTIELQHRSSEDIVQAITPLLPENTKIQTFDNKLIINTSPENYKTIKNVITTLDMPAVQLRIKLYNGNIAPSNSASISESQYELGTSSLEKDNRYVRSTSRESNRKTDELLVMSGEVAILETQVTLPLLNSQYAYRGEGNASAQVFNFQANTNRAAVEQYYQYHQLNSGLMIRPLYMKGSNKVLLEFLTTATKIDHQNQMNKKAYSQFKVGSKMMLPMNQWIYVGGNRLDKPSAKKYEYRTQAREKKNQHLWVYIEKNLPFKPL